MQEKSQDRQGALRRLFGVNDENMRRLETLGGVRIGLSPEGVRVDGAKEEDVDRANRIIHALYPLAVAGERMDPALVSHAFELEGRGELDRLPAIFQETVATSFKGRPVRCRTLGQYKYILDAKSHPLTFAVGPAGTGKTYLAIAMAVAMLKERQVERIVLTRPAVEAGERLGFLPGDLSQKVDPYLRPLFDALFDLLGTDTCQRLQERGIIEVAPLAYMRGRTLSDAFIILDEAQNTTREQMKMFLTRIGFRSRVIVTGDPSQVDLPRGRMSGLEEALRILDGVKGIAISPLSARDVVRHELVQRIVEAYENAQGKEDRDGKAEEPR